MPALCPVCHKRPAKRVCPALRHEICPVCCATSRQVEIRCPSDCAHLAAARQFPAAAVKRQREADLRTLLGGANRFSDLQTRLFFGIQAFFLRPAPADTPRTIDADVVDAARALAATLETASRGIIFEHTAATRSGQRLADGLKPVLQEAGKGGGSRFEREAAEVLRFIAESAAASGAASPTHYLDIVRRVLGEAAVAQEPEPPPLILPA